MRQQKDYIRYEYNGIKERRKMTMESRAGQFNPFDALTGLGALISEAGMITDERIDLSADQKNQINETLLALNSNDSVRIIYYDGRLYQDREDTFVRFDQLKGQIVLKEKRISLDDLILIRKL